MHLRTAEERHVTTGMALAAVVIMNTHGAGMLAKEILGHAGVLTAEDVRTLVRVCKLTDFDLEHMLDALNN